jgi:hypothetical protein
VSEAILYDPVKNFVCVEFIKKCVEKLGTHKVKEYIEMQLMNNNDVYDKFSDWFEKTFASIDEPLETPRGGPQTDASGKENKPSYSERREQLKNSKQKVKKPALQSIEVPGATE